MTSTRLVIVVFLLLLGLIMALLYHKITSRTAASNYQAAVTSVVADSSQQLTVNYAVTNTSNAAGSPSCSISASSPGGNVAFDAVGLTVQLQAGQTVSETDLMSIANANYVVASSVSVSCPEGLRGNGALRATREPSPRSGALFNQRLAEPVRSECLHGAGDLD